MLFGEELGSEAANGYPSDFNAYLTIIMLLFWAALSIVAVTVTKDLLSMGLAVVCYAIAVLFMFFTPRLL